MNLNDKILKQVKHSPTDASMLYHKLAGNHSRTDVARAIDEMRKNGKITHLENGNYE
jgi:hypothetical protein